MSMSKGSLFEPAITKTELIVNSIFQKKSQASHFLCLCIFAVLIDDVGDDEKLNPEFQLMINLAKGVDDQMTVKDPIRQASWDRYGDLLNAKHRSSWDPMPLIRGLVGIGRDNASWKLDEISPGQLRGESEESLSRAALLIEWLPVRQKEIAQGYLLAINDCVPESPNVWRDLTRHLLPDTPKEELVPMFDMVQFVIAAKITQEDLQWLNHLIALSDTGTAVRPCPPEILALPMIG